jgi:hypothetical protein
MQPSSPYRPRVSRETRLLLMTGVLAVAALWLLARIRFQDLPVTPNPVPSVLSQIASGPKYDDLAGEIAQLQLRLQPSLFALQMPPPVLGGRSLAQGPAAVRLRDELAVTLLPNASNPDNWRGATLHVRDAASGLAVVRVAGEVPAGIPAIWTPRRLAQPRYFMATEVWQQGVSLRPTFVASLDAVSSPLFDDPVWAVPPRSDLAAGSFLFSNNAELVGLVIAYAGQLVIVPGATVLAEANRLVDMPQRQGGTLGVQVQALSEALSVATGAPLGVVVSWVEPESPASGQLAVGDVIEAMDGRTLESRQQWDVRIARLSAGDALTLRTRRRGETREVAVTAVAVAPRPSSPALGLALRARPTVGAEVVRIERSSAGDRAGLAIGDVITLCADVEAPTPGQVAQAFASTPEGQRVLIAVTRGTAHFVTTLER